jgi:hypothetical protein
MRPDANEVRDLWLLVAFEVLIVTAGFSRIVDVILAGRQQGNPHARSAHHPQPTGNQL